MRFPHVLAVGLLFATSLPADEYAPTIAKRSNEGQTAIRTFRVPEGMTVELVASEPDLANPVCFCIDERGRFYVGETFRQKKGVEDNRSHMNWLHDDLAATTVADRVAFFKKHMGEKVEEWTREHDRIRLLEDTDGDGKVDRATVYADGFNRLEDGTGAGLLARGGSVWYTCIPDLWQLRDEDGDGVAEKRDSLHTGYGVRVAFRGHDMHGLVMGPDGRLYFSIGDRGYNVTTKEGERLVRPDTGAVFRCEPDGSKLEVFAHGLRNPQELAFDDFGNLFTGDNNSDSGDRARWVHVVRGGDTGWRMYFQYLEDRGPWNREMMWYPIDSVLDRTGPGNVPKGTKARDVQPASIVPPVANLGDGPSGLVAYPGVGLSKRYDGHFFLCDFRGNAANSGIRSFAVKPKGASFELVDSHEFLWQTLVTDVDFGYDGSMYATDWVAGWDGPGKGRLYRYTDTAHARNADGVATLIREGFGERSEEELVALLSHADRRVRQEAQFALVELGNAHTLSTIARDRSLPLRPRAHAILGLGQLARRGNERGASGLNGLVYNQAPEILELAARTFGENVERGSEVCTHCIEVGTRSRLVKLLTHESLAVRAAAAMALGSLGRADTVPRLLAAADADETADPVLRHAIVMGLSGIASHDGNALADVLDHPGAKGRMTVLLALRRLGSTSIVRYLKDPDLALQLEAARAVNDVPITAANRDLAELAKQPLPASDALIRRVMNANYRLGEAGNAVIVGRYAANPTLPVALRLEAVEELRTWGDPSPIDRVTGRWAPLEKRDANVAEAGVRAALGSVLAGDEKLLAAGVKLAATHGIKDVGPTLLGLLRDTEQPATIRAESLAALDAIGFDGLADAAKAAVEDDAATVRIAARRILVRLEPKRAADLLDHAIENFSTAERQDAIALLGTLKGPRVEPVLRHLFERLAAGTLPSEILLDVIELGRERREPFAAAGMAAFERTRNPSDPLSPYVETLAGGDVARGEAIFFGRSAASCRRCHLVNGSGGIVGPNLSTIGKDKDARYLLEAIVKPNAKIAKGYETVVIATIEGRVHAGILKGEDDESIRLMQPDGQIVVVPTEDVDDRATGKSGMPEDIVKQLTKADIRDLVAYLSSLKVASDPEAHGE